MTARTRASKPARAHKPAWLECLEWSSNADWFRGSWLVQAEWRDADTLMVRVYRRGARFQTETASYAIQRDSVTVEAFARVLVARALVGAEKRLMRVLASVRPRRGLAKPERARDKGT